MVKQLHNELAPTAAVDAGAVLERLFELASVLGDGMHSGLAEWGLSAARAEVLWELHRRGRMTQRELSEVLRCTPRNVTGLLDALQQAGLVARGPHPHDRRAVLVALTEQGVALAAGWREQYDRAAVGLFGDLPPAELASFARTLELVLRRLLAASDVPGEQG
jgi:DNA-binding MarR family transcriptional regulator